MLVEKVLLRYEHFALNHRQRLLHGGVLGGMLNKGNKLIIMMKNSYHTCSIPLIQS